MRYSMHRDALRDGETEVEVHCWTYLDAEDMQIIGVDTNTEQPDELIVSAWMAETADIELSHRDPEDK